MDFPIIFPKRPRTEIESLENTLEFLDKLFKELKLKYRVFGSIIPAALLGRPQRRLGDIDLMVETRNEKKLFSRLEEKGYKVEKRTFRLLGIDMVWGEATNKKLYALTLFLGNFDKNNNFTVKISNKLKAVASRQAIKPTRYKFGPASFIGIPTQAAYYGAWVSRNNPKRKYDLAVFKLREKDSLPVYSIIDFYYKNKKVPFLYSLSCWLQNFLGKVSISLGKNYDFWRK